MISSKKTKNSLANMVSEMLMGSDDVLHSPSASAPARSTSSSGTNHIAPTTRATEIPPGIDDVLYFASISSESPSTSSARTNQLAPSHEQHGKRKFSNLRDMMFQGCDSQGSILEIDHGAADELVSTLESESPSTSSLRPNFSHERQGERKFSNLCQLFLGGADFQGSILEIDYGGGEEEKGGKVEGVASAFYDVEAAVLANNLPYAYNTEDKQPKHYSQESYNLFSEKLKQNYSNNRAVRFKEDSFTPDLLEPDPPFHDLSTMLDIYNMKEDVSQGMDWDSEDEGFHSNNFYDELYNDDEDTNSTNYDPGDEEFNANVIQRMLRTIGSKLVSAVHGSRDSNQTTDARRFLRRGDTNFVRASDLTVDSTVRTVELSVNSSGVTSASSTTSSVASSGASSAASFSSASASTSVSVSTSASASVSVSSTSASASASAAASSSVMASSSSITATSASASAAASATASSASTSVAASLAASSASATAASSSMTASMAASSMTASMAASSMSASTVASAAAVGQVATVAAQ